MILLWIFFCLGMLLLPVKANEIRIGDYILLDAQRHPCEITNISENYVLTGIDILTKEKICQIVESNTILVQFAMLQKEYQVVSITGELKTFKRTLKDEMVSFKSGKLESFQKSYNQHKIVDIVVDGELGSFLILCSVPRQNPNSKYSDLIYDSVWK